MANAAQPGGSAPYAGLTPDCVLDALQSVGLHGDGRLLALNSYENRVYQVWLDPPVERLGASVVAKFYRPQRWSEAQILEEHAFARELAEAEVPVVAPLAWGDTTLPVFRGFRFAVYPRQGGRSPELEDEATLERIGRFIARIHAIGARAPFAHRPALDVIEFGERSRDFLLAHDCIPDDLRAPWRAAAELAIAGARQAFERAGDVAVLRLHGDCHAGNLLWTDTGPHFVDLDDARMGPAVQDLWMLLSGERSQAQAQLGALLDGYELFREFDRRELLLVEALRTLRLLHYSAWLAQRWGDPAFPAAFPWFGSQRYWQDRVLELREQVAAMDEPPLHA